MRRQLDTAVAYFDSWDPRAPLRSQKVRLQLPTETVIQLEGSGLAGAPVWGSGNSKDKQLFKSNINQRIVLQGLCNDV